MFYKAEIAKKKQNGYNCKFAKKHRNRNKKKIRNISMEKKQKHNKQI